MNNEQKKEIGMLILTRAEISGRTISPMALAAMVNDLDDLDFFVVKNILKNWGRTETSFPYAANIREKIKPELSHDDNANEVASLIISCVSKFGRTNQEAAKNKMGELAWEVVRVIGGWKHICETMTVENENTFRAQARELARAISKKSLRGELGEVPMLPKNEIILNLASNVLKSI